MDLLVLVGQRKERYVGEYAVEALAVIDEHGDSENPDYMRDALKNQQDSGDFDALAVVQLSVDGEAIHNALYPSAKPIPATVVGTRLADEQ